MFHVEHSQFCTVLVYPPPDVDFKELIFVFNGLREIHT